jgi:hypothetical protein
MFKPELTQQPTNNTESELSPELKAGREALLADLEAAGEEGLRIIYYASDITIHLVPNDPESVTYRTQEGNNWFTGNRKFVTKTTSINDMVLHSKYINTQDQDEKKEKEAA